MLQQLFEAIVGSIHSSPNTIGKKTYEKIANFLDNIANVDTCNINALYSLYDMLGEELRSYSMENFAYPEEINRLVNILSIKYNTLVGNSNKFSEFFDSKFGTKDAINLGKEIDIYTHVLTGGVDNYIVAYEKFNKKHTIQNANLPVNSTIEYINSELQTFALSTYHPSWGWGLVLPANYNTRDIFNSYSFFEYIKTTDDTQITGMLNWSSPQTTITNNVTSLSSWNNTVENIFYHTLAAGLNLI